MSRDLLLELGNALFVFAISGALMAKGLTAILNISGILDLLECLLAEATNEGFPDLYRDYV